MSVAAIDPPTIVTLAGNYLRGGMRASAGNTVSQYPFATATTSGWEAPYPCRVRRLSVSGFVVAIGSVGGTVTFRVLKGSLVASNTIFKIQYTTLTPTTWQYDRDTTVDNAGKDFLDTGDVLLGFASSKGGTTGLTNMRDITFVVDVEPL